MSTPPPVLLASSSVYRQALLNRLLADFDCATPAVDESAPPGESPENTARRLSRLKALSGAKMRPDAVVIGADQVPALGERALRKPGSHQSAVRQLRDCAGQTVVFYSAVAVVGPASAPVESHVDTTTVRFRALSDDQIQRYLEREQPYDCAGSFKAEALGIVLLDAIDTHDPTAIQGLPLIWLSACLRQRGLDIP